MCRKLFLANYYATYPKDAYQKYASKTSINRKYYLVLRVHVIPLGGA